MNASRPSAIFEHWATAYIGKPWVSGARGPEAFDCWGLVRHVQQHTFNRPPLPEYPIPPENRDEVKAALSVATNAPEWIQLPGPVDRCAVALSRGSECVHVGVYLAADGGLVLHALERVGVVAESLARLRARGWSRVTFYNHSTW